MVISHGIAPTGDRNVTNRQKASIGLIVILIAATIGIVSFAMSNGSTPIGPPTPSASGGGSSLICESLATPVGTCTAINASTGLQSSADGGTFTFAVITPTLVPTATPQPTATPGAGGACPLDSGLPIPDGSDPSNTAYFSVPGVRWSTNGSANVVAQDIYYEPFQVCKSITVTRLAFLVTSAGNPSDYCRLGIASANSEWQATNLVIDGGQVINDSTGWKIDDIADTVLAPGAYVNMLTCNTGPGLGAAGGETYQSMLINTGNTGTSRYSGNIRDNAPTGTPWTSGFSDPVNNPWQTVDASTGPFFHFVLMSWDE